MANYKACSAKSKRSGKPCKARAMNGTTVCYMHGGKAALSTRGRANGNYKHGLFSKHVPKGIKEFYESALSNEDMLNLYRHIALVDSRIMELFGRVGDNSQKVKELKESCDNFTNLFRHKKDDANALHKAFIKMENASQAIDGGIDDADVWGEIHKFIEQRRRLTDSDVKRVSLAETHTRNDKILVLFDRFLEVVPKIVSNKKEVRELGIVIQQLIST